MRPILLLPGCRRPRDEARPQPESAPPIPAAIIAIEGQRQAYVNPWIDVWHYDVRRADGSSGIYGVVHFQTRAVGVLAFDAAGRTVLVGQDRFALQAGSWEIPEGGVPAGEPLADGALRELQEETGWVARAWAPLLAFDLSNSVTDEVGEIFLAWDLDTGGAPHPDEDEAIAPWIMDPAEAVAMVLRGEIRDAISIMALLAFDRGWAEGSLPAPLLDCLGPYRRAMG